MERWLVFSGDCYYASGGMKDFVASYPSFEEAITAATQAASLSTLLWAHVADRDDPSAITEATADHPQFDIVAQIATLGADSLLPPYKPTPGELRAMMVLRNNPMIYWEWRGSLPAFRKTWYDHLIKYGFIKSDGPNVSLTDKGIAYIVKTEVL